jgi:large subunit ribosomal protein L2
MDFLLFLKKKVKRLSFLTLMLKSSGGRNLNGKITAYHRGGGHKKFYKNINFNLNNGCELAIIRQFEYDANRNTYVALICFLNGELSYILATDSMKIGDLVFFNVNTFINLKKVDLNVYLEKHVVLKPNSFVIENFTNLVKFFDLGSSICNFKLLKNNNLNCTRSAGSKSMIVKKYNTNVLVKLPSKQLKLVPNDCSATFGQVANSDNKFIFLRKAGVSRWLGKKPSVRGVAKNPVDHPHGGGEGKTSGGRCSVTPWGILTKGYPTVRGKKRKNRLNLKLL